MSYNSIGGNKFLIYLPRGEVGPFTQYERVLFYYDMIAVEGTVLLNTVDHNKAEYSERGYTRDLLARKIQYTIALPSHRHIVKILEDKVQMLNCPINRDEVRGAE